MPNVAGNRLSFQQAALREAVGGAEVRVRFFVRMEYSRGVNLNLIEMWCLIRESVTVQDSVLLRRADRAGDRPRGEISLATAQRYWNYSRIWALL